MTSAAANSALRHLPLLAKGGEWNCVDERKSHNIVLLLLLRGHEIEKLKAANAPLNFITTWSFFHGFGVAFRRTHAPDAVTVREITRTRRFLNSKQVASGSLIFGRICRADTNLFIILRWCLTWRARSGMQNLERNRAAFVIFQKISCSVSWGRQHYFFRCASLQ